MTPLLTAFALGVFLAGPVGFIAAGFLAWSKCRDEHYTYADLSPQMRATIDGIQADYRRQWDAA